MDIEKYIHMILCCLLFIIGFILFVSSTIKIGEYKETNHINTGLSPSLYSLSILTIISVISMGAGLGTSLAIYYDLIG